MTVSTDAGWDAAAAAPTLGVLYLIELHFTVGTVRVTNWPVDLPGVLGQDWTGLGVVAEVGELRESEDGNYEKLTLALTQVRSPWLSLALGSPKYQGRPANIWVGLVDAETLQITGTPVQRFAGSMELVEIPPRDAKGLAKILLHCQAGAYDRRSNPAALRMNQAQHAARHPGETGFRYVPSLIGQPKQWLSKRFQEI